MTLSWELKDRSYERLHSYEICSKSIFLDYSFSRISINKEKKNQWCEPRTHDYMIDRHLKGGLEGGKISQIWNVGSLFYIRGIFMYSEH